MRGLPRPPPGRRRRAAPPPDWRTRQSAPAAFEGRHGVTPLLPTRPLVRKPSPLHSPGALGTLASHGHHDQGGGVTVDCRPPRAAPTTASGRRGHAGPRRRAGGRPRARVGPDRRGLGAGRPAGPGAHRHHGRPGSLAGRRLLRQGPGTGVGRSGRGALRRHRDLRPHGTPVPRRAARHRPPRQALLRRARHTRRPTADSASRSSRPPPSIASRSPGPRPRSTCSPASPGRRSSRARPPPTPIPSGHAGTALVLAAGNVASLGPRDALSKLFVEGKTVVMKANPVNDYLVPHWNAALASLVDAGVLRIVEGGAEAGQHLTSRPRIDEVHITGSDKTYDAVVFGPGAEGERRKAADEPVLAKPVTAELGNVSPVIVVPGTWTIAELQYQAEHVATMLVNNAGFNCLAARVVVTHAGMVPARRLPRRADAVPVASSPPAAPTTRAPRTRRDAFLAAHPEAESYGTGPSDALPWTVIPVCPPAGSTTSASTWSRSSGRWPRPRSPPRPRRPSSTRPPTSPTPCCGARCRPPSWSAPPP